MLEILGIHSDVAGEVHLDDGHAWLSMHFTNGEQTTIGLWTSTPLQLKNFVKDPTGLILDESFDVNFGLEAARGYRPKVSRYYKLSNAQARRAVALMGSYTGWRITNTCAAWAAGIMRELQVEDLDASELGGMIQTPRALSKTLTALESRNRTTLTNPKPITSNPITKGSLSAMSA